tara:strand:- start:24 stop:581 length:558 start_codon:yes stop_codon:yes gene_type:complete
MEGWRQHLTEEELAPCPNQPLLVGEFREALRLASMEPAVRKDAIEQLRTSGKRIGNMNKIFTAVGILAAVPAVGAAAGVGFVAGLLGTLAFAYRAKQEKTTDKGVDNLLALLCIDNDLLELVDNSVEKQYWADSNLKDKVDNYANSTDINEPMPNFTRHFLTWLNTQSAYAADSAATPNTQVIEK